MRNIALVTFVILGLISLSHGFAYAEEPTTPRVDQELAPEKEQRIDQLKNLSLGAVFDALKSPEFFDQEDYLNRAIFVALNFRVPEAIELALGVARSPQIRTSAEGGRSLYISKRIIQVFPNEAVDELLDAYTCGGPKIKANIIYIVGQMAGGDAVRTLLIEALYDTTICEDVLPETIGDPLRICDVVYNQLVMRYKIKNVMRTIGSVHRIDVRDYHIQMLQEMLLLK
jgi:hypothetical protein